jgi:hypothetical protein
VELRTRGSSHECGDTLGRRFALEADGDYLFGDRHFDAKSTGEIDDGSRASDALCHAPSTDCLREWTSLTERHADAQVPAFSAGAGSDEITDAGKSGEGTRLAAERFAEANQLRE